MAAPASYADVVEYLRKQPAASISWAEGLVGAGLSMPAIITFMETMATDYDSPLREAEEGVLKEEVHRMNVARGGSEARGAANVKFVVTVRNVLSAVERTRVTRAVASFCQPVFEARGKFGHNGHAVMNSVRRVSAAYLTSKIPNGACVVEVGPDVKNWLLSPTQSKWRDARETTYVGARPVLTPRDAVRVQWEALAKQVGRHRERFFSAATVEKAAMLESSFAELFPNRKIQEIQRRGEYIVSYDSNYDIAFSDMPVSMALCGSRAWHGCMVRAKGVTRHTRLEKGVLDLLGVNYRVDWKAGRIDFRHPECTAFGYSHNVWEYMKYEECNGFTWTTRDCHYVYTKGPETSDEMLFFSVIRVPKITGYRELRYVENPHAKMVRMKSVWAIGDEINGVPSSFQQIEFYVDALSFSKVLEKRRALDFRGDLAASVALVRSTNVTFFLNGTPVGATAKVQARLAEATAVVVEALVAENRLKSNMLFERAMLQYDMCNKRPGFLVRLLASMFDVRAATGAVAGPVMRIWESVRGHVLDKALSPLRDISIGAEVVGTHILLGRSQTQVLDCEGFGVAGGDCLCMELGDVRHAIGRVQECEKEILLLYEKHLLKMNRGCSCAYTDVDEFPVKEETADIDSGYEGSTCADGDDGASENSDYVAHAVDMSDTWRAYVNENTHEHNSMIEFVELETYLLKALMTEVRVDSDRITKAGRICDRLLEEHTTSRTVHNFVEFLGGRQVRRFGKNFGNYSALYDHQSDTLVKVSMKGSVACARVKDGFYYTCDKLKVQNSEELIAAVNYALDYGQVKELRKMYKVVVGVPGAGKTTRMVAAVYEGWKKKKRQFLIVSATNAAVDAAVEKLKELGMPEKVAHSCCMSIDKYLMHKKTPTDWLCVDEFPAMHIGKVDAAAAISDAKEISLFGDARQIPYDPFCAEYDMRYGTLGDSVDESRVEFMAKTHRFGRAMCAIWLDQYPAIYPCTCCDSEAKAHMSISLVRGTNVTDCVIDENVRYHTFDQASKEEVKNKLGMRGDMATLRAMKVGGLATTHEDQGSTHASVVTIRPFSEYDKNASSRNPSLYNRVNYVLSDMTRAVGSYTYRTACEEDDEVCRRIRLQHDEQRLKLVDEQRGMGRVSKADLLL